MHLEFSAHIPHVELQLHIPIPLQIRADLLQFYIDAFQPPYSALIWDSFTDCLSDLSWLSIKSIVITHSAIPALITTLEQAHYLDGLNEVVQRHAHCGMHQFRFCFPPETRAGVTALIDSCHSR